MSKIQWYASHIRRKYTDRIIWGMHFVYIYDITAIS